MATDYFNQFYIVTGRERKTKIGDVDPTLLASLTDKCKLDYRKYIIVKPLYSFGK